MAKIAVFDAAQMMAAQKQTNNTVKEINGRLRAHARVLNYATRIERLEKSTGRKVNGILSAFETFNKAVIKRIGATGLTAVDIVTPAIKAEIIEPYLEYLDSLGNSKSINGAIEHLEEKRKKELDRYGKTEETKKEINRLYDLQINKFVLPLKVIEAQFNSLDTLKKDKGSYGRITNIVKRMELAEPAQIIEETTEPTENTIG